MDLSYNFWYKKCTAAVKAGQRIRLNPKNNDPITKNKDRKEIP
jgi:hypothetical protein